MLPDLNLLKKITLMDFATDYSTGGFQYPPLFVWPRVKDIHGIEKKIKAVIRDSDTEFSLYAHFPFCIYKCAFCRFFSLACKNPVEYQKMLDCIIKELKLWANLIRSQKKFKKIPLEGSIYLGGGTPTLFDLEKFFGALKEDFEIQDCQQINLESSLDALNEQKLRFYKKAGVNRLLIGIQSLNPEVLKKVKRFSLQSEILEEKYYLARKVGLPIVTFELICGLPGQSEKSFFEDLKRIINLKPEGIHIYHFIPSSLTLWQSDRRSWLEGKIRLISERAKKTFLGGHQILEKNNYIYTGDEWIAPGNSAARNLQISLKPKGNRSLIAIGPSAVGFLSGENRLLRTFNTLNLAEYQAELKKNNLPLSKYFILKGDELERAQMVTLMRYPHIYKDSSFQKFSKELFWLMRRGILKEEGNSFRKNLHPFSDTLVYPKIFYSPKILKRCERIIKTKYL